MSGAGSVEAGRARPSDGESNGAARCREGGCAGRVEPAKCGQVDCLCHSERIDVHSQQPKLPEGFFMVVKRVPGESRRFNFSWIIPGKTGEPLCETEVRKFLNQMRQGSATNLQTLEEMVDLFMQHKLRVKKFAAAQIGQRARGGGDSVETVSKSESRFTLLSDLSPPQPYPSQTVPQQPVSHAERAAGPTAPVPCNQPQVAKASAAAEMTHGGPAVTVAWRAASQGSHMQTAPIHRENVIRRPVDLTVVDGAALPQHADSSSHLNPNQVQNLTTGHQPSRAAGKSVGGREAARDRTLTPSSAFLGQVNDALPSASQTPVLGQRNHTSPHDRAPTNHMTAGEIGEWLKRQSPGVLSQPSPGNLSQHSHGVFSDWGDPFSSPLPVEDRAHRTSVLSPGGPRPHGLSPKTAAASRSPRNQASFAKGLWVSEAVPTSTALNEGRLQQVVGYDSPDTEVSPVTGTPPPRSDRSSVGTDMDEGVSRSSCLHGTRSEKPDASLAGLASQGLVPRMTPQDCQRWLLQGLASGLLAQHNSEIMLNRESMLEVQVNQRLVGAGQDLMALTEEAQAEVAAYAAEAQIAQAVGGAGAAGSSPEWDGSGDKSSGFVDQGQTGQCDQESFTSGFNSPRLPCNFSNCVCHQGLDVHNQRPLLPVGFSLVVQKVAGTRKQYDYSWSVHGWDDLLEEDDIEDYFDSLYAAAGAYIKASKEEHKYVFLAHKQQVKRIMSNAFVPDPVEDDYPSSNMSFQCVGRTPKRGKALRGRPKTTAVTGQETGEAQVRRSRKPKAHAPVRRKRGRPPRDPSNPRSAKRGRKPKGHIPHPDESIPMSTTEGDLADPAEYGIPQASCPDGMSPLTSFSEDPTWLTTSQSHAVNRKMGDTCIPAEDSMDCGDRLIASMSNGGIGNITLPAVDSNLCDGMVSESDLGLEDSMGIESVARLVTIKHGEQESDKEMTVPQSPPLNPSPEEAPAVLSSPSNPPPLRSECDLVPVRPAGQPVNPCWLSFFVQNLPAAKESGSMREKAERPLSANKADNLQSTHAGTQGSLSPHQACRRSTSPQQTSRRSMSPLQTDGAQHSPRRSPIKGSRRSTSPHRQVEGRSVSPHQASLHAALVQGLC